MELTIDRTEQIRVLEDFFSQLAATDQRKVFMSGFKKGAKPMVNKAKATAPIGPGRKNYKGGNLKRSIGALALPGEIAILVGARKTGKNKGHHGHFVESGTKSRQTQSGKSTGKMPALNFFEKAFDATQEKMYDSVEEEWLQSIDRFITSTNRRLK